MGRHPEIEEAILDLLAERQPGKTICPSEAARRVCPEDWRPLMTATREAAQSLVAAGRLEVLQRGDTVDIGEVRGPVRLRVRTDR